MPFVHEHAARQAPPSKFVRFARMQDQGGPGIHFVIGYPARGGGIVQSVRFDAARYDTRQARAWLRQHGFKATGLEAARKNPRVRRSPKMQTRTIKPRGLGAYYETMRRGHSFEFQVSVMSYRVVDGDYIDNVQVEVCKNGRVIDETDDDWQYAVDVVGDSIDDRVYTDARTRGLIL